MSDKKFIYFGHPVNFYNTDKEEELIAIIEKEMPEYEIENPNQQHHQEWYQRCKTVLGNGMLYYFNEVLPKMETGIFLPFEDGMFGAGVYGEAKFLSNPYRDIYEISLDGAINPLVLDEIRCLSIEETKKRVY